MDKIEKKQIIDLETEELNDRNQFENIKQRGLVSVKALAVKPPESRSEAES